MRALSQWFAGVRRALLDYYYPWNPGRTKLPIPPRPSVDVAASMQAAMQQFSEDYQRPPVAAVQRLADLARGPAPSAPTMGVPALRRIDKAPRRTLTRADALKRNLKGKT